MTVRLYLLSVDRSTSNASCFRSLFSGVFEISSLRSRHSRRQLSRSKMIGHSNLSLSIMVAVIVLVSNSTAFTLRQSQESNCRILQRSQDWGLYHRVGRYCHKKELLCLSLASRDEKSRSSDEILISMKQVRSKKSYNVPGYVRGRLDLISSVFKTYSLDGEMAYSSFLDSKYLRFWPGTKPFCFPRTCAVAYTNRIFFSE